MADSHLTRDVVVLIPVYNNQSGLDRTLRSIAAEGHYQVVVVDDGSRPPIVVPPPAGAPAPIVIRSPRNVGIAVALNLGVERIVTENRWQYIARVDSSDEVRPGRFGKQVARLEAEPRLGVVSSWVRFVHPKDDGRSFNFQPPTSRSDVRLAMSVRNVLVHSAAMFRLDLFREGLRYSTNFPAIEDYELFWRILQHYDAENIPELLTYCEQNPHGISTGQRRRQLKGKLRVQLANWRWRWRAFAGVLLSVGGILIPYRLLGMIRFWPALYRATYAERG